ncbi:Type I restriction enzyme EcoKI specificity protein [Variovorax sp. SRS16]|uniref:restriction endonuclease subunit S n=1 Tax=Variovorax sp. SRS16 TaxID=282217 RepID=UPI001318C861|nr:restriction endonuclease subunit S [Variovorax sp. SRS16]VTU23996.1 Type I restriction enzyme EcoKI specificity protein [Variovorax sp. SRS16]
MSTPGRPKGEYRSAQREGTPVSTPWVALRDVVEPRPGTLNPAAWPDDPFTYIDVAGVCNKQKAITGARTLKGAEAPSRARRQIRHGDVLVSTVRPNLNAVALVPESLDGEVASTAFCVLRATPAVLPQYLYFFVRSRLFVSRLCKLVAGALYPAVTDAQVLAQTLPLPDLQQQRRIVDLLSCAQSVLRLRRDIQKNTARMIPALFNDMFGNSMTNPKGWPVVSLGSLLQESPQNGLYKHKSAYGSGTPILRIDAFYDGEICDLTALKRLRLDDDEALRFALAPGDIVINRVNSPEYLGKSTLIPALAETTVFESNMMRLRLDTAQIDPRYMISMLQTQRAKQHIRANARRAINQASINQQDVKSMPVLLPPLARQSAFARCADATTAVIAKQAEALIAAEATFEALLARVFQPMKAAAGTAASA